MRGLDATVPRPSGCCILHKGVHLGGALESLFAPCPTALMRPPPAAAARPPARRRFVLSWPWIPGQKEEHVLQYTKVRVVPLTGCGEPYLKSRLCDEA